MGFDEINAIVSIIIASDAAISQLFGHFANTAGLMFGFTHGSSTGGGRNTRIYWGLSSFCMGQHTTIHWEESGKSAELGAGLVVYHCFFPSKNN